MSVFSTAQRNLALSTLQDGTAKCWMLGSVGKSVEGHKAFWEAAENELYLPSELRNLATDECLFSLKGHRTYITSATQTLNLQKLSGTCNFRLLVEVKLKKNSSKAILSRDGLTLLTGSWDRSAKLWNLQASKKTAGMQESLFVHP